MSKSKEPQLFAPGGFRKIKPINAVFPFVGGGSIFRVLHDLDVPLKSIAIIENDPEKVKQAKDMIRKFYPDIDVDSENSKNSKNFTHQSDARVYSSWDEVKKFMDGQGGCDFFYGTPSCATNSRLAGFGPNKQFLVPGPDGHKIVATEDIVNAMSIEDLIQAIDEHGKSGSTFKGMMYGLKELQPKSGGTEHGEISKAALQRAYERVMNDARGLDDKTPYFEKHHAGEVTDVRRDRNIGHFTSGSDDVDIWAQARELYNKEGLKVPNKEIGYYSDKKEIKTMADIRRQLFEDRLRKRWKKYKRLPVENTQRSFTKSSANKFYWSTNARNGSHKKGQKRTPEQIMKQIAEDYTKAFLPIGGFAREPTGDDKETVIRFETGHGLNAKNDEIVRPILVGNPERTAALHSKNKQLNKGASTRNPDILNKDVVLEGWTPEDETLMMGKSKDDIPTNPDDLYEYQRNLGDSEDERIRIMSIIRELGLLNHLPPEQRVLAAKEILASLWTGGYVE